MSKQKNYVITGGAAGIGAAVVTALRGRGDKVIVVDLHGGDIAADLSTEAGCHAAIDEITRLLPDGVDGLVPCAGLGPHVTPFELIPKLNFFGTVRMVEGLQGLLKKKRGVVVAISSNSASLPGYDSDYVQSLLSGDEKKACDRIAQLDGQTAYGGSKFALAIWVRKTAPRLMTSGVRMNAVAPGITKTAMTDGVFDNDEFGEAIRQFNDMTPCGNMATPEMVANSILFLLDPVSEFVCGSILFVDGGTDALLRSESF